jgi:tetratricopeptide (TPR) repeat protein
VARISPSVLLLLLPVSTAVWAQQGQDAADEPQILVERLTGPIPEHVAEFDQVHDRYVTRMGEFQDDAREYVELIEKQKRRQIVDGYGRIIAGLRDDEEALRTLAKARFEDFLGKYPRSEASPHVMFRLAELYYEDAENNFLVADSNYNDRLIEYDEVIQQMLADGLADGEELPDPPEPAKKDYSKALALYDGIADSYPGYESIDGVYYMLGYCLTEENAKYPDNERGLEAMKAVVRDFPASDFINDASMRLGEYYFEANDLEEATLHYQRIVDRGEDARFFDKGLYKLAWSHYRLASIERFEEYDIALGMFVQLLDYSDRLMLATGEQSSMKPEAIQYAAISFSDMSDLQTRELQKSDPDAKISPISVAETFFEGVGQREYELDIYVQLAEVLTRQARYLEAVESYEYLQTRWPDNPKNPEFQYEVARLYMSLPTPDKVASAEAERDLVDRYSEGTGWWTANRANPDALAVARGFTEQSTANVAKDLHLEAQKTGNPEMFSQAADKYREYLLRFPFADDYYEMEWYLADALFQAKRMDEAEREFLQLLKTTNHQYSDGALFRLMQTRMQQLVDKYGEVKARPESAIVERVEATEFGGEVQVFMLTDEHSEFIEVADQILGTPFSDPAYLEARQANISALTYLPAQIYYEFGHYDEALKRLETVIDQFPAGREAEFAAGLVLNVHQNRNDMVSLNRDAKRLGEILARAAADDAARQAKLEEIKGLEVGSAVKMAEQLVAQDKRDLAAEAYRLICETYPDSEFYQSSYYNWDNKLEIIGKVDESIVLFEEYINKYPSDEKSEGLFFRIAGNYAQILELETAVRYYKDLVKNFPESENKAAAIYNAAFLQIGLGQHEQAARGLEYYATEWPDNADAEKSFYLAGNEWEQVSEAKALEFYERYLRRYGSTDVNHALTAQYRIIKIYENQGKTRSVERAWEELERMFVQFSTDGETIPAAGRKAAAEGTFPVLWEQYQAFREVSFNGDQLHDATILMGNPETGEEGKPGELKALDDACLAFIKKYQDFTYSSAALYIQASARFDYAQMIFDAPPPDGFSQEMIDILMAELDKVRIPVEEKGKALALYMLEDAKEKERWSEWQSKTLDLLNARFPQEYPAEKIEARYTTEPRVELDLGPLDIIQEEPAPPPPPAAPAATPAPAEASTPAPAQPTATGGE